MSTSSYALPPTPEENEVLLVRTSGAAQRALDHYLKEGVSASPVEDSFFEAKAGISDEEALVHACELLRSAAATAYESANGTYGNSRDLALSVVHLIDMAKVMVERSLGLPPKAPDHQTRV